MTSNLQFNLLNNIGQTLVKRGSLPAVLSCLSDSFSEAFPHAYSVLYLRQGWGQLFVRQAAFPADWNPEWIEQVAPHLETIHHQAAKQSSPLPSMALN